MSLKSLMLGSAATLVAVAGAQAADLPSKKAAPATYVKVCDAYGAGFFYIPGSDTCLRVGGYVRVDYDYRGKATSTADTAGYYNRGVLILDARTATSYGPVRTYIQGRWQGGTGTMKQNQAVTGTTSDVDKTASLEAAMVQFAGFTFGQGPQLFSNMSSWAFQSNYWTGWPNGVKQLSYTHNFGGGLSAHVSMQDGTEWGPSWQAQNADATKLYPYQWQKNGPGYVGVLRLDQGWGAAQVMGAYINKPRNLYYGPSSSTKEEHSGWAVGAGLNLNLPMLAPGDQIQMTAVYFDGLAKLGPGTTSASNPSDGAWGKSNPLGIATKLDWASGWTVGAQMVHYWTTSVRQNFFANHTSADLNQTSATVAVADKMTLGNLGTALIWSPTRDFDIGVEVQYLRAHSSTLASATDSNWGSRLRVERRF